MTRFIGGLLLVLFLSVPSLAADHINVTVSVDKGAGTFQVFVELTGQEVPSGWSPQSAGDRLLGIAGFVLDIKGTGGLIVVSTKCEAPQGIGGLTGFSVGRTDQQPISGGFRVGAIQNTSSAPPPPYYFNFQVLNLVGIAKGIGAVQGNWNNPVLIASGTFSGNGTLTCSPENTTPGNPNDSMAVLYGQATGWNDPAKVEGLAANTVSITLE